MVGLLAPISGQYRTAVKDVQDNLNDKNMGVNVINECAFGIIFIVK